MLPGELRLIHVTHAVLRGKWELAREPHCVLARRS